MADSTRRTFVRIAVGWFAFYMLAAGVGSSLGTGGATPYDHPLREIGDLILELGLYAGLVPFGYPLLSVLGVHAHPMILVPFNVLAWAAVLTVTFRFFRRFR